MNRIILLLAAAAALSACGTVTLEHAAPRPATVCTLVSDGPSAAVYDCAPAHAWYE